MKPLNNRHSVVSVENPDGKIEAALRRLVDTNLVAVLFTDLSGNILNADDSFLKLLGYTSENLPRSIHDLTPPEHHRLDEEAFEKLMAFGACAPFEKDFLKHDGSQVPVLFGAALHEEEIACFVVDLSQNKQTQEKLNHLAYHDALTDLPNQVLFKDRLKQAIALSRRNDQMQAVLLLNVDRFKTINDSLGYTAGDRLLQSVAQRLTSCVRESDTVARFGADEFAILLTQIPRAQDAANAARAIKQSLDQAFLFEICLLEFDGALGHPLLEMPAITLEILERLRVCERAGQLLAELSHQVQIGTCINAGLGMLDAEEPQHDAVIDQRYCEQ